MATAVLERIATSGKALLLLASVCVLMAHRVHGGCCAVNLGGGPGSCNPKTNPVACATAGGTYSSGNGIADWQCVIETVASPGKPVGFASCNCPVGSACGDPHIKGFDGSNYILWGKKDATYDLLSERNHQVNIRLFDDPVTADRSDAPKNHALFIDAVGLMINDARITVRMVNADAAGIEPELASIISSSASPSKKRLAVSTSAPDGKKRHAVWTGKAVQEAVDSDTFYAFTDETHVAIRSSQLVLTVVLRDNHHLDVQTNAVAASWTNVHGVLGQTYAAAFGNGGAAAPGGGTAEGVARNTGKPLSLDGKEEEYITSGLLSADDKFSRFVVGGSKLHVLFNDATAQSRKMLKAEASAGTLAIGGHGPQDVVRMVRSDAGLTSDI